MDVKELIGRIAASPARTKPAADAFAANRKEVAARGAEMNALAKKVAELTQPIDADAADAREFDRLQAERQSLRADVLTGDAKDADLAAVDAKIASIRDRRAKRGDAPEVAAIARTRTHAKLATIQEVILALQKQAPRLFQDVLLERMAQRATAFNESLDTFLDSYLDIAAMCHAHDVLCPLAPGSTGLRSGFMEELAIPLPAHRSFAQTTDHNLKAQIVARAAALLADVPRIA